MVYPNSYCIGFCYWMLNNSWQQLTPSRLALITLVYNAAVAGTSVTSLQYNNFTQITSWRLPFYQSYLLNELPYSVPPVGTCDVWLSPAGLRTNQTNAFGSVNSQGNITLVNDILGGAVSGSNVTASKNPALLFHPDLFGQPYSFGINASALSFLNLSNALALTNNKSGYTVICIANCIASGSIKSAFYFSSGTSAGAQRIGIACNTAGAFIGQAKRLDADVQATLTSSVITTGLQIIAFTVDYSTGKGVLYNNGVATATNNALVTAGSTSATNSTAAQICALNGASQWNGLLLDCLAFRTALSAANVLTLSNWLNSLRRIF